MSMSCPGAKNVTSVRIEGSKVVCLVSMRAAYDSEPNFSYPPHQRINLNNYELEEILILKQEWRSIPALLGWRKLRLKVENLKASRG